MDKEIIGYKWKYGFQDLYEEAARSICRLDQTRLSGNNLVFGYRSVIALQLEKVGVLDLWFDPIYKEPSKDKTFVIHHGNNESFKLTVKKEGFYFKPEGTTLDPIVVKKLIAPSIDFHKGYKFKAHINLVDLGCKHLIPVSELEPLIKYWEENFNK